MLVPAITRKDEIISAMKSKFYSDDMMLASGGICNWIPNITDDDGGYTFQYAVIDPKDNNKLIGYIGFYIDWYTSKAYNFGMISFDNGNPIFGRDLREIFDIIINKYKLHKAEWHMVGGNPVEKHYDKFCKKYNGNKYILKDSMKDTSGNFRDDVIYEVFFN